MCGESRYHQRSLTHHSQFSRLGIQCPTLVYVMFVGSGGHWGEFLSILSEFSSLASVLCTCFSCKRPTCKSVPNRFSEEFGGCETHNLIWCS